MKKYSLIKSEMRNFGITCVMATAGLSQMLRQYDAYQLLNKILLTLQHPKMGALMSLINLLLKRVFLIFRHFPRTVTITSVAMTGVDYILGYLEVDYILGSSDASITPRIQTFVLENEACH